MKVLITGGKGQLGRSLVQLAPETAELTVYDREALDITDAAAVERAVQQARPDVVINAAAYTAVDKAESDEELARQINADAVGHLSAAAAKIGARFVHVSTDFVFDGNSSTPYTVDAPTCPLSVYGHTKLAGERLAGDGALIVRTAWVYAPVGGNFVRTMLRLMEERDELGVVGDQIGSPTYAPALARTLWSLVSQKVSGTFHYTDNGVASWYDFAVAIAEEGKIAGLLANPARINCITTADYPTPAHRPAFSVLDKSKTWAALGRAAPHWRDNLRLMIKEIAEHG